MRLIVFCLQDNKEPSTQFSVSCTQKHGEQEKEAEVGACWVASWNASGTLVAVTSNHITRLTVFSMETRQVVRQALVVVHSGLHHLACVARLAWKLEPTVQSGAAADLLAETGSCPSYSSAFCVGAEAMSHTPCLHGTGMAPS